MAICEQFIYTTGKTKHEKGYQVISKSPGITKEIISECENYLYPAGINPNKFSQSRSLIILKKNKVAFSIIKNIGVGFDGRPGTIYNHTFVMEKDVFQKLDNDTRIFEQYYNQDPSLIGELSKVMIETKELPINFEGIKQIRSILPGILTALFKGEKIAIFKTEQTELIQTILSIIPPSTRLISFSTYVERSDRQPKYDFILTSKSKLFNLGNIFRKFDPEEKESEASSLPSILAESIRYLLNLVDMKKEKELIKIHDSFEQLSSHDFKNKIILVTNYEQFMSATNEKLKQKCADNIFEVIKKFDNDVAMQYLEKIKTYSKKYAVLEDKIQSVINPYTSLIDACIILPAKLTAEFVASFIGFQKKMNRKK